MLAQPHFFSTLTWLTDWQVVHRKIRAKFADIASNDENWGDVAEKDVSVVNVTIDANGLKS